MTKLENSRITGLLFLHWSEIDDSGLVLCLANFPKKKTMSVWLSYWGLKQEPYSQDCLNTVISYPDFPINAITNQQFRQPLELNQRPNSGYQNECPQRTSQLTLNPNSLFLFTVWMDFLFYQKWFLEGKRGALKSFKNLTYYRVLSQWLGCYLSETLS